jgi:asparagine N-glycosylation enzyme membrane subunit Stt3
MNKIYMAGLYRHPILWLLFPLWLLLAVIFSMSESSGGKRRNY